MKELHFNEKAPCVCGAGARLRADSPAFQEDTQCSCLHRGDLVVTETTVLKGKRILGDLTIAATAPGTAVRDCVVEGNVSLLADDTQLIHATVSGTIQMGKALNLIVAASRAKDIVLDGAKNSVILKNKVESITAQNGHAIYVIENVAGKMTLTDNNYLIADCNASDTVVADRNDNTNGNNLMDVDARLPVGADENLLPHTDKDLFVDMPRKTTVLDPDVKNALPLPVYVNTLSLRDEVVIVPPGAYTSDAEWNFTAASSHTTVYAYGVYAERQKDLGTQARFVGAKQVTLKGITFAYRQQSCGQVHLLEKLGMEEEGEFGWVRVVSAAGMMDEFGNTNPAYFNTNGMGAQRMGTGYAYCDSWFKSIEPTEADGTRRMRVYKDVYNYLANGDVLTCRACNGGVAIPLNSGCEDVVFYDLTMFGGAAGFAWVEGDNLTATTYFRVANTTRSAEVIDEETYRRYRAYEEKYGVSLEVYQDALGRFRGAPAHIGSIDATHTTRCAQGSICVACMFENMCDDGTNQNHTHARIADIKDNGDGTATILYKGCLSMYSYNYRGGANFKEHRCGGFCADFKVGDRVYVYNSAGQLICDTPALTATVNHEIGTAPEYGTELRFKSVTVATSAVNFQGLEGYDLSANTPNDKPGEKVLIDNMSQASNGFIFDNTLVRNIRSRGLLIKASDSKIVNCSFKNIGMSCAAILYEIFWGESGVTENMEVARNLFDHTGYFNTNWDRYAPVAIEGLGSRVDEDYLLYKNIVITDNVIRNRTTKYAVYVNSAQGITIRNNDFGESGFAADVHLNGAMNVELSDNIYSDKSIARRDAIVAAHVKNIYGSDVMENGKSIIPDQE